MDGIVGRYIMPHTLNLLPSLGGGLERKAQSTVESMDSMAREIAGLAPDTIVVISSHAPSLGNVFVVSPQKRFLGSLAKYRFRLNAIRPYNDLEFVRMLEEGAAKRSLPIKSFEDNKSARRRYGLNGSLDMGTYVPLFFVNQYLHNYKLVVISLSDASPLEHYLCGKLIAMTARDKGGRFVVIASGELSHKVSKESPLGCVSGAADFDQAIVECIEHGQVERLLKYDFSKRSAYAPCGVDCFNMLLGTLDGKRQHNEVLSYEHPFGVGLLCAKLDEGVAGNSVEFDFARKRDGRVKCSKRAGESEPCRLARAAIKQYLKSKETLGTPVFQKGELLSCSSGVYVSLFKGGRWRGCYGNPDPTDRVSADDVIDYAITAAVENDVGAVSLSELGDLEIVVDFVRDIERVESLEAFDHKKYGMLVKYKDTEGIILPNVPHVHSVEDQYRAALYNAGASEKDKVKLYRFTVERFR